MSKYKYAIFDAQYILTRNFKAMQNQEYFSQETLARSFFWSIAKYIREMVDAEKVVCLWDKWPYHSTTLLGDEYKGDRYYASEEELEGLDPVKDKEEIERIENELRINKIKQGAKYWIINAFNDLGILSFIKSGYEADNFAYVIAQHLKDDDKKSIIISRDSDWKYLISKNVDYAHDKTGETWTLEDMEKEIPEGLDISLYLYKSVIDSLYGSHNNIQRTLKEELPSNASQVDIIRSALNGEMKYFNSDEDLKQFQLNLSTFTVENYPEYENVKKMMYYLDKSGRIMSTDEFNQFRLMNNFQVSDSYYRTFSSLLNKDLYQK